MIRAKHRLSRRVLPALVLVAGTQAASGDDFDMRSADTVNEGTLHFLEAPPATAVHHHENRVRVTADSLRSGWVELQQCHSHMDAVPRSQITFREGYVRGLAIDTFSGIGRAWVEGASVQLENVAPGARLCLSAQTRALRNTGNGYYSLSHGPYMRKFLDGYYPMHVTLDVAYPAAALRLLDVSPERQPGFAHDEAPGRVKLDTHFEGELRLVFQFERR